MQVVVYAEQFLPAEDKIPKGVTSDGPRSPKTDPRAAYVLHTEEGMSYVKSGDWVVTTDTGTRFIMPEAAFEANYKPLES